MKFSRSALFVLKTCTNSEFYQTLRLLKPYFEYLSTNESTLLSPLLGMYTRSERDGAWSACLLFGNVLTMRPPRHIVVKRVYDTKGTVGRCGATRTSDNGGGSSSSGSNAAAAPASAEELRGTLRLDVEWQQRREKVVVSDAEFAKTMATIARDAQFLLEQNRLDYSLLIGLAKIRKAPSAAATTGGSGAGTSNNSSNASSPASKSSSRRRRRTRHRHRRPGEALGGLLHASYTLTKDESESDEDENEEEDGEFERVVVLGIIDFIQEWSFKKRSAGILKSFVNGFDFEKVSSVSPQAYAQRFLRFVEESVLEIE